MHSNSEALGTSFFKRLFVIQLIAMSGFLISSPGNAQVSKNASTTKTTTTTKTTVSTTSASTKEVKKEPMAPLTGKKMEVWELKQTSKMVGPITCMIAPQAVRIRAEKMGITWMFKAPKWDAYLFNTETKNFCSFPYAQWKDRVFFMPASGKTAKAKAEFAQMKVGKTGKTESIAGAKAYEVGITKPGGMKYGSLWMASDIVAPPQFSEVVGSMMMVPIKTGGAPLRAQVFQPKQREIVQVFDTVSASKKSVDTAMFEPMKGFNKVKDEMALLFAESPDGGGGMFDAAPKNSGNLGF